MSKFKLFLATLFAAVAFAAPAQAHLTMTQEQVRVDAWNRTYNYYCGHITGWYCAHIYNFAPYVVDSHTWGATVRYCEQYGFSSQQAAVQFHYVHNTVYWVSGPYYSPGCAAW